MKGFTKIKEYEGYINLSEFDLRQQAMIYNDVIAHAQLDANKIYESVIGTNAKIKVVRLNAEEVEIERIKIMQSGLIHSMPPIN